MFDEQAFAALDPQFLQTISGYFIRGDVAGAMKFMEPVPEVQSLRAMYADIFEQEHYISYDLPETLNPILLAYQQYFRDVFYLHKEEAEAEAILAARLQKLLGTPDAEEETLTAALEAAFAAEGRHILCGRTNGHRGPYVWNTTVPTTFAVELPDTTAEYTVNILRGFVMRSWMDYLTFGAFGTGGWASPDGIINCVETAYDFESEKFRVSLLKHEAQHVEDRKRWPEIEPWELEYRAKLVELIYTTAPGLLNKFLQEADSSRTDDSHAVASGRLAEEMGDAVSLPVPEIQKKARELFVRSTEEMNTRYC